MFPLVSGFRSVTAFLNSGSTRSADVTLCTNLLATATVLTIGWELIEWRFSMGSRHSALHLAEDICYNLRRVLETVWTRKHWEMSSLLAAICTTVRQLAKAMTVHEEVSIVFGS